MDEQTKNIDIHFFQLVFSLQSATMLQLGKIASPVSGKVERDMAMAKTTIDMLGMIQNRTEGNLEENEKKILDTVMMELQMNYIDETARSAEEEKAGPADEENENEIEEDPEAGDEAEEPTGDA